MRTAEGTKLMLFIQHVQKLTQVFLNPRAFPAPTFCYVYGNISS